MFDDYISFIDDNEEQSVRKINVKILEITSDVVKFEAKSGNIIVIPLNRVLKIKQRARGENDAESEES